MKFSKKGYLRNSPDVNNPQNIIQGGKITMKGVDFKVHGVDNNGYAKVMTPGYDYNFPNAKYVTETPIKNINMSSPFQKKFSEKSPLMQEIDPTKLQYRTTNTATTLSGEVVPTSGVATAIIPPSRKVENIAPEEQYLQSFKPEYQKAIEGGYTGTLPEYIKEKEARLGYTPQEVEVTRERDYDRKVKTFPNPFKGMRTYNGVVLDAAARDRDSLESKTITNIFKRANDDEGFQAYLDEHGYKRRKGKPKTSRSEKIGTYRYTVNPRSGN